MKQFRVPLPVGPGVVKRFCAENDISVVEDDPDIKEIQRWLGRFLDGEAGVYVFDNIEDAILLKLKYYE